MLLLDDRAASALLPTPAALTETFRQTVFGSTDWRVSSLRGIRRWQGQLNMSIVEESDGKYLRIVEQAAAEASRLTGLPSATLAGRDGSETLELHFVSGDKLAATAVKLRGESPGLVWSAQRAACLSGWLDADNRRQSRGYNLITTDYEEREIEHCIFHELGHSLGMVGHIRTVPSVMRARSYRVRSFTLADKILLRTIYDPRLRDDMWADEAMPIARTIIDELVAAYRAHGEAALTHPRHRPASAGR